MLVVSAAGAVVQGCLGIGFGLVAGPALVAIDSDFAPGPILLAGQLIGLRHALMERVHTDRKAFRRSLIGLPVGLVGGIVTLTLVDDRTLRVVVGALTAVAAIALLAGWRVRRTARTDVVAGGASAFASVTAGLPGPPLVLNFSDMAPAEMRGTSSSFILFVALTGITGLALAGEFGMDELLLTARLVPGVGLGMFGARYARPYLDRSWFRPAVLTMALLGALALVARQLL
ncbi:MAG: sulfite exporter TauE/SafE family protein [Actinomycetota bacterium]